jgi:hypothetical protein
VRKTGDGMGDVECIKTNYYALAIAAIVPEVVSQEIAFGYIENGKRSYSIYSDEDTEDMLAMRRQGMKLKEIGAMYGISEAVICHRIKKLLKKGGGGTYAKIPPGKAV